MVTGRPVGGDAASGIETVLVCPAAIDGSLDWTTIGLPAPVIDTFTGTSVSSFWPWFMTWTSNERLGEDLMSTAEPCWSVWPPGLTVTVPSPVPWTPGVAG